MINRFEFEKYLCNYCGCEPSGGTDVTLRRQVGGEMHYASFGNHSKKQVEKFEARKFLKKLGFSDSKIRDILNRF